MNVNITGIYDNTVVVDSNLFEDVRLLQTGLSTLSDSLYNVVEALPNQYANLQTFTTLSNNYNDYKTNNNSNISNINNDIDNLTSSLSTLSNDINNNYVTNTTLSTLSTAIDDQFELTTTYIDEKITEQHEYTDQEIEALRTEGYIQEAVTQLLAWATSDEGKRFRKKLWTRISSKWASLNGRQPATELLDDVQQSTSDELDDLLKVYRYDGLAAGIRCDAIIGKDIVMNGDTYIYNGNLYLTGDINKGTFNSTTGTWTQQKVLNDYFIMKGVKTLHCLDINSTTDLLELHYDDLDFELGPAPYYYLKLKYPIHSVHPTHCLSIDPTTKQLEFNINTDYFDFEQNSKRTLRPKFDTNGVDDAGPLFIDFSTRKLRTRYNDTLQVNASKELCTTFDCKGLKTGSVLFLDSTTKLLDFKYDTNSFKIKLNDELELKTGNSLSTSISGVDVKLADTSLSLSSLGLQVSTTYKSELQQLKNDTETFKTQAQQAKTTATSQATIATNQAEIATTQATAATTQATTATSQATIATTQATAATTQATAATAAATSATAAAASATASSGAAAGAATAAAASAAAAAVSATTFQKGDKGDTGSTGPTGPQGPAGNPLSITWQSPLNYNSTNNTASINLSDYVNNTTFSTFSTSTLLSINNLNNKTNFSSFLISNASTLLSALNVSGFTTLNSATTINSTLNVVGNIIGSGTALTNLNYNTITNKPDLTGYALTTNLNNISTSAILSITNLNSTSSTTFNNLNNISTSAILSITNLNNTSTTTFNNVNQLNSIISNSCTIERQYPPKNFDSSTTETTTTFLGVTSYTETLTINSFSYGVGNYIIYSSSTYNNGEIPKKLLFNFNLNDSAGAGWLSNYISPAGTYNGSSFIVSGYTGDWIVIKLPVNIVLTKFRFHQRATLASRSPSLWRCYGSNDGITFTVINDASNDTTEATYTSGIYEKVLPTSFNTLYKYIGFTIKKILGGANADMINIQEIQIFGKELLPLINELNINNLNITSTTIFNNLNSLSTNSILSINNLNNTSTTILNNLNSLSTNSILSINNLNNTSTSLFNKTNFTNLLVSNASTLLSSLNITGNIIGSGTALTNLNYNSILNPPSTISFNNPSTFISTLNISGNTTLNNVSTCISSLNVSGITTLQGNVDCGGGIAINGSNAFHGIASVDAGNYSNTYINFKGAGAGSDWAYLRQIGGNEAIKLALDFHDDAADARFCIRNISSVSIPDNPKEVFSVDMGNVACTGNITMGTNNSYPDLRLGSANGNNIGIATTATAFSNSSAINDMVIRSINKLILQSGGGEAGIIIDTNNYPALRRILKFSGVLTSDDVAFMNSLIFNQGAFAGGVFAGDNFISSYWGVSILLNSGGNSIPNSNLGRGYDGTYASFTVNARTGTTAVFDRKLFTIRGNGQMIMYNDQWHITNDNIYRFYFSPNSTTFICSGGAATDNGFIVYSSGASGGYNVNLGILNNGNTTIRGTLNSSNITCPAITLTNSSTAIYVNGGGNSIFTGKIGVSNLFPQSMLHLGSCDVSGSAPVIVFGKNTGSGYRNAFMGYTDSFFFVIGDYGNTNAGPNTLTSQLAIIYNAPASSLVIQSSGYVQMAYGFGTGSDERIKTNIKTIENALDKTLLLRGVEYNDFRIEPKRKRIGLIAQEVELIIPEVVRTGDDGLKGIEYQNLVGLLIEAIKEQQKQINDLKNRIIILENK